MLKGKKFDAFVLPQLTKQIHNSRFANREIREVECIINRKNRNDMMKGGKVSFTL